MSSKTQDPCCAAVRRFLSRRTSEPIGLISRPDITERRLPSVEEIWESRTRGYAVEHTRIEAFERQLEDDAKFSKLIGPIEQSLTGLVPGRFTLWLKVGASSESRIPFADAQAEIVRLVLKTAGSMADGATAALRSERLPFELRLVKRHSGPSRLLVGRWLDAESSSDERSMRIRRALEEKSPKLHKAAASAGYRSVLILESNDIALTNVFEVAQAFKVAAAGYSRLPDMVFLVETDASPLAVWTLKDGDRLLPNEPHYDDVPGEDD